MIRHLLRLSLPSAGRSGVRAISTALLMTLLTACSLFHGPGSDAGLRAKQPQTWQGEVSCPGCNERWLTLTLFPDGLFRLRETYLGEKGVTEERFHDVGRWSVLRTDSQRVVLKGASTRHLRLLPEGDMALLDATGNDIVSIRDYRLKRLHKPDLINDPMRLLALYVADGSNGVLTECLTAQVVMVADTPAAATMKQMALALPAERRARGPTLAAVTARWDDMSNTGRHLVIEQFDRLWPNETCAQGPIAPAQPLQETVWQLLSINGVPAQEAVLGQAAHIRLRKGGRLTGSTGCNRLQGSWQRNADRLGLSRIGSSRANCRESMSQQEQALQDALRNTRQFRQVGHQLELLQSDQVLARFVAAEML